MATDRRTVLRALGAGAAVVAASSFVALNAGATRARPVIYLNAQGRPGGDWRAGAFDAEGRLVLDEKLPGRGHGFALDPVHRQAVVFSRRPGTFAVALDLSAATSTVTFHTPADRHFYGHGVFSPGGGLLYATENDFARGRGVIGVYDAKDGFRRLGELPSHGTGPHDLGLMPDGEMLVVANGGIRTHPDLPRAKLNLATMAPSLVFLDRRDGTVRRRETLAPDWHQASLRHLAVTRTGAVAFALQYQGPAGDAAPLAGIARRGGGIRLIPASGPAVRSMKQYCGSVAFDSTGAVFATTAPRGGVVTVWRTATCTLSRLFHIPDVCGVAPAGPGRFIVSSGLGGVYMLDAREEVRRRVPVPVPARAGWDNHMLAVADGAFRP